MADVGYRQKSNFHVINREKKRPQQRYCIGEYVYIYIYVYITLSYLILIPFFNDTTKAVLIQIVPRTLKPQIWMIHKELIKPMLR
jgi:hypothetical protein